MTTPVTPTALTPVESDPKIPVWVSHALTVAVPVASFVAAKLGIPDSSAWAQALVMVIGIVGGIVVHLGIVVSRNGITKAGLEKTISEEEIELRKNLPQIKAAYASAVQVINSIPGGADTIASITSDLNILKGQVDQIPAASRAAALDAIRAWLTPNTTGFAPPVANPPVANPPVANPPVANPPVATVANPPPGG